MSRKLLKFCMASTTPNKDLSVLTNVKNLKAGVEAEFQAAKLRYQSMLDLIAQLGKHATPQSAAAVLAKVPAAKGATPGGKAGAPATKKAGRRSKTQERGLTDTVRKFVEAAPQTFSLDDVIAYATSLGAKSPRSAFATAMQRMGDEGRTKKTQSGTLKSPARYERVNKGQ